MRNFQFVKNNHDKMGIEIRAGLGVFISESPIDIEIKESEGYPAAYSSGYETVEQIDEKYIGNATIETKNGSVFKVTDTYEQVKKEIIFSRNIEVVSADGHDAGFSSSFGIKDKDEVALSEYDVFIPGIWYRKNENVVSKGFGSNPNDSYHYIRITRMAMPYVELYHPKKRNFLVLKHLSPQPETGMKEMEADWLVDSSFQYASMGIKAAGSTELRYNFPGSEGEKNYIDEKKAWARRSHPVAKGIKHAYSFSIWAGEASDSYDAMRKVWRYFYEKNPPKHAKVDIDKLYKDSIELLNVYCQEYNGAMGIPFWATVPEGTVCDISFQMGFVGQQTMCAYQLMRYGYKYGKIEMVNKSKKVIDFWVNESTKTSVVPRVWYNAFPDTFKLDYPTYTRTVSEGMEGILVSYLLAKSYGNNEEAWYQFCLKYADWMVENQNADGSFYRSYDENGNPVHMGKFNTSNVIRFLINMYWVSKNESYKNAAIIAGQYCYDHIYLPMQFVGGTADNDNTIDKEAGMIAMYAFMTLYDLEKKEQWLEAAKGAADFCETWTYVWDYPVKKYKGNAVFDKVSFTGLSLIATGHSHADVMMGYMPFEYYRLYLHTKDKHYEEFSRFINGNTKQTMDWSGKLGHVYPGLIEESGELAMQYHNGLGRWLPWCTIAEIESLTRFQEHYGTMDMEKIEFLSETEENDEILRSSWLNLKD